MFLFAPSGASKEKFWLVSIDLTSVGLKNVLCAISMMPFAFISPFSKRKRGICRCPFYMHAQSDICESFMIS